MGGPALWGLPLTKAVFDYALVRMLVVTDPRRRTWLEMRIEYGTHSFRTGDEPMLYYIKQSMPWGGGA